MKTLCSNIPRPDKTESSPTVGDIFRAYGSEFRAYHRLHPRQHKVMYDIEHCRCGEFGTHWEICDTCGHLERRSARIDELLPVSYHHCVFTLPDIFNPLCRFNRRVMYDLLFECASQTLLAFGENPKRLGARIGFYGILHTWGGKLWLHPHIHFIVTAGGVNTRGDWVEPKYNSTFLFPVRALSNVFRAKFLSGLIAAHGKGLLKLPGDLSRFGNHNAFKQWLFHTVPRDWVVYSKPPFSGPEDVVRYIGRYTHSTAISNNRVICVEDDIVTFWFKNTRKNCRWETTTLPVMEFINRFLVHVLPKHFHRIRYYGFLANGKAKKQISSIRRFLNDRIELNAEKEPSIDRLCKCPACGTGTMMTILVLDGFGNVVKDACSDVETEHGIMAAKSP